MTLSQVFLSIRTQRLQRNMALLFPLYILPRADSTLLASYVLRETSLHGDASGRPGEQQSTPRRAQYAFTGQRRLYSCFYLLIYVSLYLSFFAAVTAVLIVYNDGELFAYQPLTLQSPTSTHGLFSNLVSLGSVHIAISITYLFYNHLLSRMFAAVELNTYLKKRSPLRVTNPRPGCRPSYYLNLPPQFFVPLLITLAFLHFLTTHSLHVVSIDAYDIAGQYSHRRITFGTSTSAAILALVLGFVLLFALAIALERPLSSGMPVLGTCSMAISAACHADDNAHLGPIRYGRNSKTRKAGFHVDGSQDRGLSSG